jgi:hypothetical protein
VDRASGFAGKPALKQAQAAQLARRGLPGLASCGALAIICTPMTQDGAAQGGPPRRPERSSPPCRTHGPVRRAPSRGVAESEPAT